MSKDIAALADEELIDAYLKTRPRDYFLKLPKTEEGRAILSAEAARRARVVAIAVEKLRKAKFDAMGTDDSRLKQIISDSLRAKEAKKGSGGFSGEDLAPVVGAVAKIGRTHRQFEYFPHKSVIAAVEKVVAREGLNKPLREALAAWREAASPRKLTREEEAELNQAVAIANDDERPWSEVGKAWAKIDRFKEMTTPLKPQRELLARLDKLLLGGAGGGVGGDDDVEHGVEIKTDDDAVGAAVRADRGKRGAAIGAEWGAVLRHAVALTATSPSKKWLDESAKRVARIPHGAFAERVRHWLSHAGKPAAGDRPGAFGQPVEKTLISDASADLLKGLCWTIVAAKREDLAPELGALAAACFAKVKDHGPRNVRVANAAVGALAGLAKPLAGAQLAQLRPRVKHPSSRKAIDKALATLRKSTGLSIDDLAEIDVPTMEGQPAKEVAKARAAQSLRIERLLVSDRSWLGKEWRERYLDHPLVGQLARRLIWVIDGKPAAWQDGKPVDVRDKAVALTDKAKVGLWHPTMSKAEEVLTWRRWLERHEVVQPFKQAHREVYLLTDAERKTKTYSNRFAAHVLRQHQLAALCQARGWEYAMQGQFDSCGVPTLVLPALDLTCEFYVEGIESHLSPRGVCLYVGTDQVRFNEGMSLEKVPKVAFSEVMRDVDLFVGVASVGNDPLWEDGGPDGAYRDYWREFSFGELGESAQTRRAVLETLLPRLKIASRCALDGKFLRVRGDLRTYKIHLGSGNVLMEPNDEYLCIVPARGGSKAAGADVFLPFEGDQMLSVILSKAFLLAEDRKIKDPTITRQIRR